MDIGATLSTPSKVISLAPPPNSEHNPTTGDIGERMCYITVS